MYYVEISIPLIRCLIDKILANIITKQNKIITENIYYNERFETVVNLGSNVLHLLNIIRNMKTNF